MKRGKKGITPVCRALVELVKSKCPDGFYPWCVVVSGESLFCYARTQTDAIKKVMYTVAKASPCTVEDIIEAKGGRVMSSTWQPKPKQRCPHCRSMAAHVACVKCNRDMCEDCISFGEVGKVCGICKDRKDGRRRWLRAGSPGDFDDWYDDNA